MEKFDSELPSSIDAQSNEKRQKILDTYGPFALKLHLIGCFEPPESYQEPELLIVPLSAREQRS